MAKKRIDLDETRRVAELAHLALEPETLGAMAADLAQILSYVEKLNELDTTAVKPTTHAGELSTHQREDEPREGLSSDAGLENAPERIGDGFGVPRIIESP